MSYAWVGQHRPLIDGVEHSCETTQREGLGGSRNKWDDSSIQPRNIACEKEMNFMWFVGLGGNA